MSAPNAMATDEIADLLGQNLWTLFEASGALAGVRPPAVKGASEDPELLIDAAYEDEATRKRVKRMYRLLKDAIIAGNSGIELPASTTELERRHPGRSTRVDPSSIVRFALSKKIGVLTDFRALAKQRRASFEYSTKLLRAADAVIAKFWRDWRKGMEGKSQESIMSWLQSEYSRESGETINQTEALSVDRICRPDALRDKHKND